MSRRTLGTTAGVIAVLLVASGALALHLARTTTPSPALHASRSSATATVSPSGSVSPTTAPTDTALPTPTPTPFPQAPASQLPNFYAGLQLGYDDRDGYPILLNRDPYTGKPSTWKWDGTKWVKLNPGSMPYSFFGNPAYDPALGATVALGQAQNGAKQTLYGWDGSTWSDLQIGQAPPGLGGQIRLVFDLNRSKLCLFFSNMRDTFVWELDGTSWVQPHTAVNPPARGSAGYAYDPVSRKIFLVGGNIMGVVPRNDTWTWDGTSWTQIKTATAAPSSMTDTLAYDARSHQLIRVQADSGATWAWTGSDWSSLRPMSDVPRDGDMVFDAQHPGMLLIGSSTQGGMGAEGSRTWTYSDGQWRQVA